MQDQIIFMAQICEEAGRFEDMAHYINQIVTLGPQLTQQQTNLFRLAQTHLIGDRQSVWRQLKNMEQKEQQNQLIKEYKQKIGQEIIHICREYVNLIDHYLHKGAAVISSETKVYFHSNKCSLLTKIIECEQQLVIDEALQAYEIASKIAHSELHPTNLTRLQLQLNFMVFYYEILEDPHKACSIGQQAIDDATLHIQEDQSYNLEQVLQLFKDNLALFTSELEDNV